MGDVYPNGVPTETGNWRGRAACLTSDPEMFFPHDSDKIGISMAKRVCGQCVVRLDCLEYALETDPADGIWGELTTDERKELKRRSQRMRARQRIAARILR